MNDLYRKTFDEIHASDALRQEVLNMTKQEKAVVRRQIPRMVLIAAIVALVLAGTALAAAIPGIQEWFGQQWMKETGRPIHTDQMGLIDQLSDAVGVSATVDGVTVTVDSVTRGEDVIWFLLRYDGLPPEEELEELLGAPEQPPEEDSLDSQVTAVVGDVTITAGVSGPSETPSSQSPDYRFGRGCKLTTDPAVSDGTYSEWATFQNAVREDGTMTVLMRHRIEPLEGGSLLDAADVTLELPGLNWGEIPVTGAFTLEFSLPAIQPTKSLTTGGGTTLGEPSLRDIDPSLEFWNTNTMGPLPTEEMAFLRTKVTPTNLTIYWADREQTERLHKTGDWYLVMQDGTEVRLDTSGGMYTDLPGGQRVSRFVWPVPVDLRQAESLEYRYGEDVLPLELK